MSGTRRLAAIDSLRGIAALSVVLFHLDSHTWRYVGEPPLVTFRYGNYGVRLFFIISGFVIFMTVERSQRVRDFAFSRFTRLYPLYWASVLLSWSGVQLFGPDELRADVWHLLANLTMFQTSVGVQHIDAVYWTLSIEMSFYVAIGFAMWRRWLQGRALANCLIAWLAVSVVLRYLTVLPQHEFILSRTVSLYSHLFVAGMCFYLAYSRGWSRWTFLGVAQAVPMALLDGVLPAVITLGLLCLFAAATAGMLPLLSWRPLTFLGLTSYALYLTHNNLGMAALVHLKPMGGPWAYSLTLAGSLLLAALLTFAWERPAARWLRARRPASPKQVSSSVPAMRTPTGARGSTAPRADVGT